MKLAALLLAVAPLLPTAVMADTYPSRTLIPGSIVCFKSGDWTSLKEASVDGDQDAAMQLVNSGKCRMIGNNMKVHLVEPEDGSAPALIEMPSGKTALTSEKFLR